MIIYPVKKGDSLWKIARQYGVSLDALLAANPDIADPNYILVGQQINIPEMWQPPGLNPEDIPIPPDRPTGQQPWMPQPSWPPRQPPYRPMPPGPTRPGQGGGGQQLPNCADDPSVRPCIYSAHQGDTLEMIGHAFMVPLSRLIYYNLQYVKDEPLPEGTRIIIPENEIMPLSQRPGRNQQRRR